jgi:sodium/pantothenate symporter
MLPLVGTYLGTWFSGASLIGGTGMNYRMGWSAVWWPIFYALGSTLCVIVAPRFRGAKLTTPPEFMERRYGSKPLRILTSLGLIVGILCSLLVQFQCMGIAWTLCLGLPYKVGVLIGVVAIAIYTIYGGFMSVAWSDIAKSIVFIVAIIAGGIWALTHIGGISSINQALATITSPAEVGASPIPQGSLLSITGTLGAIGFFFMGINWICGIGTHPFYMQRISAAKNIKTAIKQYMIAWPILLPIYVFLVITPLGARTLFPTMPAGYTTDWALPLLFTEYAGPAIAGVFLAGIVAAGLSTTDSAIQLVGSSILTDIVETLRGKKLAEKARMKWARIIMTITILVALIICMFPLPLILMIQTYGWGILGIFFFPTIFLGVYWKRVNTQGISAGIISGIITLGILIALKSSGWTLMNIIPTGPPILIGTIVTIIVTLFFPKPKPKYLKDFFPQGGG